MRRLLISAAAAAALIAAMTPANAQGVGVQVGPVGVGVGPDYYWGPHHRYWRDYAYSPDCRLVRERIVTRHGHVIWRTHRECD
jgi:hypothetical protein